MNNRPPVFDFTILPKKALKITEKLRSRGVPFWLAGGFVRDWIAGKSQFRDIDILAGASVWKLHKIIGGEIIFCKFPHILFRDIEVLPIKDIQATLKVRDFTANAMAIDHKGQLIDPFNGQEDVRAGLFRKLPESGISDDPIRIIRGCRLAARLGWKFEGRTEKSILKFLKNFDWVHYIRKKGLKMGMEFVKALEDPQPSSFFYFLERYGILESIMPFIDWKNHSSTLEQMLEICDSLPQGNSSLRMLAILNSGMPDNPPASRRYLTEVEKFLKTIHWDDAAGNFGRDQDYFTASTLSRLLTDARLSLLNQEDLIKIAFACFRASLNFTQLLNLRKNVFLIQDSSSDILIAGDLMNNLARTGGKRLKTAIRRIKNGPGSPVFGIR